jgi:hypothetical protein
VNDDGVDCQMGCGAQRMPGCEEGGWGYEARSVMPRVEHGALCDLGSRRMGHEREAARGMGTETWKGRGCMSMDRLSEKEGGGWAV